MKIAFVDTETTGLDSSRHEVWEIGVVLVDSDDPGLTVPHEWQIPLGDLHLEFAEPMALRIGDFYNRHYQIKEGVDRDASDPRFYASDINDPQSGYSTARELAPMLDGVILAGNVVDFDSRFLGAFLRKHHLTPTWHYHLLDVETFAAGVLGLDPPWKSTEISDVLGVDQPETAHTALGDAKWAHRLWLAARDRRGEEKEEQKGYPVAAFDDGSLDKPDGGKG